MIRSVTLMSHSVPWWRHHGQSIWRRECWRILRRWEWEQRPQDWSIRHSFILTNKIYKRRLVSCGHIQPAVKTFFAKHCPPYLIAWGRCGGFRMCNTHCVWSFLRKNSLPPKKNLRTIKYHPTKYINEYIFSMYSSRRSVCRITTYLEIEFDYSGHQAQCVAVATNRADNS